MFYTKTAIGADWDGETLTLVALGRRLRRARLIDWLEVRNPQEEEARARLAEFLKRNSLQEARATVSLPRSSLLVRFLDLPLEAGSQLRKVVDYQLEVLHPFRDVPMSWDAIVVSRDPQARRLRALVVLAETAWLDRCGQLLRDLGLRVESLTSGATNLGQMVGNAFPDEAVVVCGREEGVEVMGFSAGRLSDCRYVPTEPSENASARLERELHAVSAAVPHLDPSKPAVFTCGPIPEDFSELLSEVLPVPHIPVDFPAGTGLDIRKQLQAVAAAYAALKRGSALTVNLLPPERRSFPKRWWLVPSSALGTTAVFLGLAIAGHSGAEAALYNRALERQIAHVEPQAVQIRQVEEQAASTAAQVTLLENLRNETWQKLRLLESLSTLLPDDTWVQELQLNEGTVELYGYSDRAARLVQILDSSHYFSGAEFTAPIVRGPRNKEVFRLRVRLGKPQPN